LVSISDHLVFRITSFLEPVYQPMRKNRATCGVRLAAHRNAAASDLVSHLMRDAGRAGIVIFGMMIGACSASEWFSAARR
jgi:hypothetical protein